MKIRQTNVNLVYPKVTNYRKKFANAEDVLNDHFMPAAILPIPDQVQDEVPRAIVQSKHGHSVLNVALTVSSFTTTYTDEFVDDWKLCEEYLHDRCDCIYQLVDELSGSNYKYVGLISNIQFDNIDDSSLNTLKKSLFKNNGNDLGDIFDVSCKLTYAIKNKYYINITLENTRQLLTQEGQAGSIISAGESQNFVAVTIDVNDRYAANQRADYISNKDAFNEILQITADIINGRLESLIKEGKFEYVEK